MANESFKVGDTVRLKSGGPRMTVVLAEEFGQVNCEWFDGSKRGSGSFPPDALVAAPALEPRTRITYATTRKGV